MSLPLLPTELQLNALHNLPFRDVLKCRGLSRYFRALVDSSRDLVDAIELGAAGVQDNSSCLLRRKAKIEALWQLNVAWANLHWLCRREIPLSVSTRLFDISCGSFFHFKESRGGHSTTIEWIELPSRRDPKLSPTPRRIEFDSAIADFAVDAARDLVVGLHLTSHRSSPFYTVDLTVHVKSISLNRAHPESSVDVLSHRFVSPTKTFKPLIEIGDKYVGILLSRDAQVSHRDAFEVFLLLDWTVGVFKTIMTSRGTGEIWQSFCFVTPDSVLISAARNDALNIFHVDNGTGSLRHSISLFLPETISCNDLRHISVQAQPFHARSTFTSRASASMPTFIPDPEEAVIILSLDYRYHSNGMPGESSRDYNLTQVVAIPRRTLARYASLARTESPDVIMRVEGYNGRGDITVCSEAEAKLAGRNHFACCRCLKGDTTSQGHPTNKRYPYLRSDQWIHETRWGLDPTPPSTGMSVYGSRFLAMSSRAGLPNAPGSGVALYDFNLRNERRGYGHYMEEENVRPDSGPDELINEDEDWDYDEYTGKRRWPVLPSRIVTKPTTVSIPEVFKKPFTTCLPYRITETELVLPWDTAILDGERIIGLDFEDFDNGTLKGLDIIIV